MAYDFLICTNAINYTIALALVDAGEVSRPWILVDFKRCDILPRPGVRQWGLSASRLRWIGFWLTIFGTGKVGKVFIPHHRLNHRAAALIHRAASVAFLDDGLDTRRFVPRNFDLSLLVGGERYYTFNDYFDFPPWMSGFDIRQITTLKATFQSCPHSVISVDDFDHVIIESPGCDIDAMVQAIGADRGRVLVVRHPSPSKRQLIQGGYLVANGRFMCTDEFIAILNDKSIYFGETISFFIALARNIHKRNAVFLVMSDARKSGLWGLPAMKTLVFSNGVKMNQVC